MMTGSEPLHFDTNILIDHTLERGNAESLIERARWRCISFVVRIEFLSGATTKYELMKAQRLLQAFEVLPMSESIESRTIIIRRQKRLKLADAIIYATAQEHGAQLYTRNSKDFPANDPLICIPYHI